MVCLYAIQYISSVLKLIFQYLIGFPGPSLIWCRMSLHNSLCPIVLCTNLLKLTCTSETIFITTNSSDHKCPAEPCLTLQEFASHYHMKSNTVLKFLPGKHVVAIIQHHNIWIMSCSLELVISKAVQFTVWVSLALVLFSSSRLQVHK